jgi:2-polyprenylphenol 6-hydroxylase
MIKNEKIIIVGGGPVGLACALAMHHARLANVDIGVIERGIFKPVFKSTADDNNAPFDHRVYALSPASITFLQQIGAWQHLPIERVMPIDAMRVFGNGEEINFRQGQALAHIVEHHILMAALWASIHAVNINVVEGDGLKAIEKTINGFDITLASNATIASNLVIGADGRASPLRALAGIDVVEKDYQSDAIVANFKAEKPHGNVAQQWFSKDGVLAYLPLPDNKKSHHVSIVWSTSRTQANHLRGLDNAAFAQAVATAGHDSLGALTLASARDTISLKRIRAVETSRAGLALVGDAAHAIHPLAGQGVNLGFGDIAALTETLSHKSPLSRIGDAALLRRYARSRSESAALMGETTDYLQSLFLRDDRVAKWLTSTGFRLFERLPIVKNRATDYAIQA